MDYKGTLDYLFEQLPMFQRVGQAAFKKDLTNIIKLCEALDNPYQQFPCIHIAGTNGKGSTGHLLSAVLQKSGLKTGLYTSPHYKDFRERIKIDGAYISEKAVVDFVAENKALFEDIRPSFFEITVALAFQHFAKEKVDIAIIETGLGGRLDSTNVVSPLLSLITNISLDHQQFLGDTLEAIASEKAGIIKSKVPVVLSEYQEKIFSVFEQKAGQLNAPLFISDAVYSGLEKELAFSVQTYDILRKGKMYFKNLQLGLGGAFQLKNLLGVLQAIEVLQTEGYQISSLAIREGLENVTKLTNMVGRWQTLSTSPLVLCDSGHNEGGLRTTMQQLQRLSFEQLHFVFGMVNDKPPEKVAPLLPENAIYYFAKANIPRGLDANELCTRMKEKGLKGQAYPSVKEAVAAAKENAGDKDVVFVGGSIFVVAEVL